MSNLYSHGRAECDFKSPFRAFAQTDLRRRGGDEFPFLRCLREI